jgi:diphosphoinositol-polyphosphate diphosphatase
MSTEELSQLVFPPEFSVTNENGDDSDVVSNKEVEVENGESRSNHLNSRVLSRQVSRQGRETQRWVTDPKTGNLIRLVTGCVPITKNGQILLVSASRKPEWILPKGGWELDETMEESAVRETFEEAGVVGVLGPKLTKVHYETRKSKKRRLEMEELAKTKWTIQTGTDMSSSGAPPVSEDETSTMDVVSTPLGNKNGMKPPLPRPGDGNPGASSHQAETPGVGAVRISFPENTEPLITEAAVARIPWSDKSHSDETSSVVSDGSATYTHVNMTLFPLYVTEVKDSWPESGRLRKAMDIDDAITMFSSRPEFRSCLIEVKEKGLHLAFARRNS